MAEAVIEVVLNNLSSLAQKKLDLFLSFDQDLKSLASLLTTIKATLEDAEEKQFTDRAVKDWLIKLKDAAHVLDDILDECSTQALELEHGGFTCGPPHKVQSSCLSSFHPKHVAFRYNIAKKMKKIRKRLDEIAEERTKFHLTEIVREKRSGVFDWRQTTSIISQPQVYGRDEDRDKIIDFLVGDASGFQNLSVYPIVGLGGLGKTTLTQLIFNHEKIVDHFELRIWVCVSEDFSLKRMIRSIIESASGHASADLELEPLQRRLVEILQRKRYLLVLDDVWDDEQGNWQRLKSVLACGREGASVLVTTRLPKVAAIMGTRPPHDLSILCDTDCWEMFRERAFGTDEDEHAELVVIGKEIAKKCGGVPLAAIALGSLLRFKREEKEWLYVLESNLWSLQGENTVMPALRLSYLNLPIKLRQCFAFCALFPKDELIKKQFLIDLWMANGFISSNEILEAEDIGNEVWNELYWRSFFQDIMTDEFGKIIYFKMHDLVHDLAQSISEEVCCVTNDNGMPSMSERTRHLSNYRLKSFNEVDSVQVCFCISITCSRSHDATTNIQCMFDLCPRIQDAKAKTLSIWLPAAKSLKTCIMEVSADDDQLSPYILKCYSLRALDFERRKKLSSSIGRLKYLRYLNLSNGDFQTLPESLCKLKNLQMINLDYCQSLQKLPNSLVQLKALIRLSLRACRSLSNFPPHIGKMASLRTLSMYVVGKKRGLLLAELEQLNLKGDLYIKHLERVKCVMDAKEANMSSKHLNQLLLSWERNEESVSQENVEEILEALQPLTQKLQSLGVAGYTGEQFPQWMSSPSFKYLNSLELVDCKSCVHLPRVGKLPSLKKLTISNMMHIIYVQENSNGDGIVGCFMALEFLLLEKLPNLKRLSWEDRENMFPRLSTLQITKCPKLSGLPYLPSLNDMRVREKCNQGLLSSIHKHQSLETIRFAHNEELVYFPDRMLQNLTSLKVLDIFELSKLEKLPTEFVSLNSIQEIYISGSNSLKSLPDEVLQGLNSLKILDIVRCPKFNLSASFQYLTCLEKLMIESSSEIEGLHEALQHMTSLQSLILCDLPNLPSLPDWLGNLGLLHELIISKCPKLSCLPMSIQRLTRLKSLKIYGCPELGKCCQKETGEDWQKIAHVQDIEIQNWVMHIIGGGGGGYSSAKLF
ncbi:putative disease resistance protein RGA3 isoform X1 [Medicago truncatula]|uniref:putative disease resistance protein RGA3 isoform X1 n=1 Tax=Medicago truncatula TaxID=3880 RepID=UPI001967C67D|nr:putative disease resistance protein RGA3 isoform X1 [Medicago truncatula]